MFLAAGHRAELEHAGLSADTIARSRIYSAPGAEVSALLGYGAGPGMVLPYPPLNGGPPYARVKLDHADPSGKRYRSPSGQPNHLYVPALVDPARLGDPSLPLWITEGEKKSLKAAQDGLLCVALSGVWSWRTKLDGRSVPLPDLDLIPWRGRVVYLCFDSDLAQKAAVAAAEAALARELAGRGAEPWRVPLPSGPHGEKVGLDDYLCTHSVEALSQIEPVRLAGDPPTDSLQVIDLPELLTRAFPPRQNLIGPALLIRQGLAVLGGSPRVGKSLLCTNLALCRALDRPWCGFTLAPGATVYVQAEIPEARLQERVRLMLDGLDPRPAPPAGRLYTITRRNLFIDTAPGRDALVRALDTLATTAPTPPDLLILDPLARFYSGDENNQREVGRFVATLDALIERFAVGILVPHHPSKPIKGDVKQGGARLRGVSGLWAAADATWWLTKAPDGLTLSFEDLRHGEPPAPLYLQRSPSLWLEPGETPTDERLDTVRRSVVGVGLSWTKLRNAVMADLETSEASAKRAINQALDAGLIAKDHAGIYRAAGSQGHSGSNGV
jgi:hypothetical protein